MNAADPTKNNGIKDSGTPALLPFGSLCIILWPLVDYYTLRTEKIMMARPPEQDHPLLLLLLLLLIVLLFRASAILL